MIDTHKADALRPLGLTGYAPQTDFSDLENACQTLEGRYFWPLSPEHPSNRYNIDDVAFCLAGQKRWGGWVHDPQSGKHVHYSIAQHAVYVSIIAERIKHKMFPDIDWTTTAGPGLYGLHHDDSEAYLVDIPRPLKPHMGDYYEIEARLMDRILAEFTIPVSPEIKAIVKAVDNAMIFMERDVLMGKPNVPYTNEQDNEGYSLYDFFDDFYPWEEETAQNHYVRRHYELIGNLADTGGL